MQYASGGGEGEQGHPMDLFLKIAVPQANFCWLGEIICPWMESVAGKKIILAGNSSFSVARSEQQRNFSQHSPEMQREILRKRSKTTTTSF